MCKWILKYHQSLGIQHLRTFILVSNSYISHINVYIFNVLIILMSDIIQVRLRKIDKSGNVHIYRLKDKFSERIKAIDEGILKKKNTRKAAIAKKARFNVLRIYRRYSDPSGCKKITRDMRYIDKKYLTSKAITKNIC